MKFKTSREDLIAWAIRDDEAYHRILVTWPVIYVYSMVIFMLGLFGVIILAFAPFWTDENPLAGISKAGLSVASIFLVLAGSTPLTILLARVKDRMDKERKGSA
ncbi:MAG: hypothetical protein SA339_08405 [Methanomassiliicoccus sp.]|nr:hypothetical protein [Methanomassiliicoccus sp.]